MLLKRQTYTFRNAINYNNATLADPTDIANAFSKYFSSIALDVQSAIRYSN